MYAISAAYAGVAGALLAETTQIASLDLFDFHRSADVMLMLVIGGAGYLYGGLIGSALFIVLRDVISAATPQYWEFWIGLLLVVLVLTGRDRIGALFQRARRTVLPNMAREERAYERAGAGGARPDAPLRRPDRDGQCLVVARARRASGFDWSQRRRQDDADQPADGRHQAERRRGAAARASTSRRSRRPIECGVAWPARSRSINCFPT